MTRIAFLLALFTWQVLQCTAQLVVEPTDSTVSLPNGHWADTVFVGFDSSLPLGALTNMASGRVTHLVSGVPPTLLFKAMMNVQAPEQIDSSVFHLKVNKVRLEVIDRHPFCLLHAEVLQRDQTGYARIYERAVAVGGRDDRYRKEGYSGAIRHALQEFLDGFANAMHNAPPLADHVPVEALSKPMLLGPTTAPVLFDSTLRKGLYPTFLHMRRNEPDTVVGLDPRTFQGVLGATNLIRLPRPLREEASAWGLCDGESAYVRVGRDFVRLDRSGMGFTCSVPRYKTYDYTPVVIAGGLLGGLIAAAIVGTSNALTGTIDSMEPFDLDLATGDFTPVQAVRVNNTYGALIFSFDRFTKSSDTLSITVGEGTPTLLTKGEWTMFLPTPSAKPQPVKIQSKSSTRELLVNTNTDLTRTFLLSLTKDGNPKVDDLNKNMADKVIRELRPEDRVN